MNSFSICSPLGLPDVQAGGGPKVNDSFGDSLGGAAFSYCTTSLKPFP